MFYSLIAKPLLFSLDPETAHKRIMAFAESAGSSKLLKWGARTVYGYQHKALSQTIAGLTFPNPIGLAAGFDKNGRITPILQAAGFGFTEVGSITARANPGNPQPRMFRLPDDRSLINRMGLNNEGADSIASRLENQSVNIPVGVNVAKTNDTTITGDDAVLDYKYSFNKAQAAADYITVNISCPNTGEGKTFEDPSALEELLAGLNLADASVPVFIKFSVDLGQSLVETLIDVCESFAVTGYVATNTSSSRQHLTTSSQTLDQIGNGGVSGRAIRQKSTQVIHWIHQYTGGNRPIIGVGGVMRYEDVLEKMEAGARLIQVYTGLIYEGPGLVKRINKKLVKRIRTMGYDSIVQLMDQ